MTSIDNFVDGDVLEEKAKEFVRRAQSSSRYCDWLSISDLARGLDHRGAGSYTTFKKPSEVAAFFGYEAIRGGSTSEKAAVEAFDTLTPDAKDVWATKLGDSRALVGYHLYAHVFPFLASSIVSESKAFKPLETSKFRARENIRRRVEHLDAMDVQHFVTARVAQGSLVDLLDWRLEPCGEATRFLLERDLTPNTYNKCALYCNVIGFVTEVLGRPCHPFSVIFPLRRNEYRTLRTLGVPEHLLCGTPVAPAVRFGELLERQGFAHDGPSAFFIDWASSDHFFPDVFVPHAMRAYRSYRIAQRVIGATIGATESVSSVCDQLDEESSTGTLNSTFNLVTNVFDMLQTCRGDVFTLAPQDAAFFGDVSASDARDPLRYKFLELVSRVRGCFCVQRSRVRQLAALREFRAGDGSTKIERGRMLNPGDQESGRRFALMLDGLRDQVWVPLWASFQEWTTLEYPGVAPKSVLGSLAPGSGFESRITKFDAENVTTMLLVFLQCDFVPLRSQVLRESLLEEYVIEGDAFRLTMDRRRGFKTAGRAANSNIAPATTWLLPRGLTELIRFYVAVARPKLLDGKVSPFMFIGPKGSEIQHSEIYSKFNYIGRRWLGIPRFGPHVCRSFFISQKAISGEINSTNVDEMGSLMQTSSATLQKNYVSRLNGSSSEQLATVMFGNAAARLEGPGGPEGRENEEPPRKKAKVSAKRARDVVLPRIRKAFETRGGKLRAFTDDLCARRASGTLTVDEAWFVDEDVAIPAEAQACYICIWRLLKN